MEFRETLLAAQRNQQQKPSENSYYKARFDPPKKEQKQRDRLSANIQKFLAKKDEEEKLKKLEIQRKRDELQAMRDPKALRKIQKTLKVIKSANKSVLSDAVDHDNTAVTLTGPDQPDQDDYGYESQEAAAIYAKMMQKYSKIPDEPKFPTSNQGGKKDLKGTMERVKHALQHEDDPVPHKRRRRTENATDKEGSPPSRYEPEKKDDKPSKPDKPKIRKPMPPPMDFNQLLKLAEQKKSEPIDVAQKKAAAEAEQERPMTKKQRQDYEEERARRQRRQERLDAQKSGGRKPTKEDRPAERDRKPMPSGFGRIPKLNDKSTDRNNSPRPSDRDKERIDRDRIDRERSDRERSDRDRNDRDRSDRDRNDRDRNDRDRSDKDRNDRDRIDRDRIDRGRNDRDRSDRDRNDRDRSDRDRSDRDRNDRVKSEGDNLQREKDRNRSERERLEREKERIDREKERIDRERLERLKAERERIDRELEILSKGQERLDKTKSRPDSGRPEKSVDRAKLNSSENGKKNIDLKSQNTYRIDKNSNDKKFCSKNDDKYTNGHSSQNKPVPKLSKEQTMKNGMKDKAALIQKQKTDGRPENGKKMTDSKSKVPLKRPDDRVPGKSQAGPSKPKASNTFDFDKHVSSLKKDGNGARQFPPGDVKRRPNPDDVRKKANRRVVNSESEYDSEMDDFIDDGEEEMDFSKHIKEIFGYDKSKYRDMDDDDDPTMESSFARQQREEFISKKIGIMEDLEDMRMEAMEKKKSKKKRRISDD